MSLSLTISSFVVVGMLFLLLVYVGGTVVSYINTVKGALSTRGEELTSSKPMLTVKSAECLSSYIIINVGNVGSSSTLVDGRATVVLDYVVNGTSERFVEVLKHGEGWFINGYYVGSKYFPVNSDSLELRPGATLVIEVHPSSTPSPSEPVSIAFVTSRGVRAEYVFTCG